MSDHRAVSPSGGDFGKPHNHRACIDTAMLRARRHCDERDVRLTPLREKVLQIVWRSHKPIGAYDILELLGKAHKSAKPPTVYRALEFLMNEGLIHKLESLNAYLGCAESDAAHSSQFLICHSCGTAEEIIDAKLDNALYAAGKRAGFTVNRKIVEIVGLCSACNS